MRALLDAGQMTLSAMSVVLVLEAPRLSVQRGSATGPCAPRAEIYGKRTQPTGAPKALHVPVITPSSLMLVVGAIVLWQNGGLNEVIVPSGDRTK